MLHTPERPSARHPDGCGRPRSGRPGVTCRENPRLTHLTRYSLLVTLDVLDAVKEEIVSTTASSKGLEYETSPLKLTMNGHLIEIDLSAPQAAPVRDALRTYVAASA